MQGPCTARFLLATVHCASAEEWQEKITLTFVLFMKTKSGMTSDQVSTLTTQIEGITKLIERYGKGVMRFQMALLALGVAHINNKFK